MKKTTAAALLLVAHILTVPALAGPLNPPAGAVTSTPKPLGEIEPRIAVNATNTPGDNDGSPSLFKITQPGSYYLTGNITGVSGRHGIEIVASGVTLDLNGFALEGVPGSLDGVSVTTTNGYLEDLSVLNGTARGWGADGVDLGTSSSQAGSVGGRVVGVHASGNSGWGIYADDSQAVTECTAYNNGSSGIRLGFGSSISNSTAFDNGTSGITTGIGSVIMNCSAYGNASNGISVTIGCTVTNCSVYSNGGDGIEAPEATVINCTAHDNSGNGIDGAGSTIAGCTVSANTLDGIRCSSSSVIRGNTCLSNGVGTGDGAGIHVTGGDNRIEGNTCNAADRGIDADAAGNIIIGNTCSGNTTNFALSANNRHGAIINTTTSVAPVVSGSSADSTLTTTDPHANFAY